ncbi:hypothetical protein [Flavobacterium sp. GSP6]|uniref:hypothetical protein n=1 Tax=Flavobacterium sp. GSP6 TaxID=2497488 RepID=UPI000F86BD78|nr:hypothetical protein [Flavobacterium sp. GSP6]RTZ05701.1 hypothetical protein EKM03_07745 [Flavobacterium sp. GSP6]
MKKVFILILFLFTTTFTFAQDIYVKGYYKSNGTYVQGHYRTAPPEKHICTLISNTQNTNPYLKKGETQRGTGYTPYGTSSSAYVTTSSNSMPIYSPKDTIKSSSFCG